VQSVTRMPVVGSRDHNDMAVLTSQEAMGMAAPHPILGAVVHEQNGYPRLVPKQHTAPAGAEQFWTAVDSLPPTPKALQSQRKEPPASD
jgi:hypothetical protein